MVAYFILFSASPQRILGMSESVRAYVCRILFAHFPPFESSAKKRCEEERKEKQAICYRLHMINSRPLSCNLPRISWGTTGESTSKVRQIDCMLVHLSGHRFGTTTTKNCEWMKNRSSGHTHRPWQNSCSESGFHAMNTAISFGKAGETAAIYANNMLHERISMVAGRRSHKISSFHTGPRSNENSIEIE